MRSDVDSKRVVDLGAVTEILDNHLTRDLVQAVFEKERVGERERSLTLHLMLQFWTAVVLRAPASLSQALRKATVGGDSIFPYVGVSKQAFFQRCANLNWEFFAEVFRTFVQGLASTEPPRFARQHAEVAERFRGIWVLDGSHLDPVARRLKILWEDGRRALPGTILGCYDLMRGTLADLLYAPTPRTSELTLARQALDGLEAGLLLVADRLYGTARFLSDVQKMGHWGVFRNQGWAHTTEVTCRSRTSYDGGELEDWDILLGKAAQRPTRLVRLRRGDKTLEFITNVLDRERLSAREIVDLYRDRWTVERVFYDLKEVLNLNCFYCGNANAVAMQVYAAAIVHTTMRVAQGRIGQEAEVEPEAISPAKLFPLLAVTFSTHSMLEYGFLETQIANPGVQLNKPDWRAKCVSTTTLGAILADKTRDQRKRRKKPSGKKAQGWRDLPPPPEKPGARP